MSNINIIKSKAASILASTVLVLTSSAWTASVLAPATIASNSPRPKVAKVTAITNGDNSCYVNLLDSKGKKYENMYASFDICAQEETFLNKKVRLTYGQERIADCQGEDPCNKSRLVTSITKMQVIK
jgi:hypothetical protein